MRTVVVFSGAGLSAESGIQTFRASDGLWEQHKVEDVATPGGWKKDKGLVLEFYRQRYESVKRAVPNAGHLALARLEEKYRVVNLTQNIDDLLEKAGCTDVRHFHGTIGMRKCERHYGIVGVGRDEVGFGCDYREEHGTAVALGDLCPKCGSQMRPDVVWFEEAVEFNYPAIMELARDVKYGDGHFIAVGTSAQVHPAASLIPLFSQVPSKHIVNPDARPIANYTLHKGPAGEMLPKLVDQLLSL